MVDGDAEPDIESIVREQADGACEECGADTDLDVYNVGDGGFSLDDLRYLCESCYAQQYTTQEATEAAVLDYLTNSSLPFVTASMVSDEFGVSTTTARDRLKALVQAEEVERYEHNSKQVFYFLPDYQAASDVVNGLREHIDLTDLDADAVDAFARQPYQIIPRDENEFYVTVPQFLNFSVGHLHDQSDAWRTYIVNRYVSWFDDLPEDVEDKITLHQRYEEASIEDNILELATPEEREQAWEDFDGQDGPLVEREGDRKIRVQDGKEFEVIADLIDGGNLPFVASPIDADDIRPAPSGISLRDYQQEAWETLEEYGQVGVYWPMGVGKSFFAMYAGSRIVGDKLVIVPSTTLKQQWEDDIEANVPDPDAWTVRTYQYLTHSNGENLTEFQGDTAPTLTIYDEAHYIPADTFSQLATLETKYRIGLSASPYREDDRTEYIFALTGMPVGIDWQELVEYGVVEYPDVHVYSYRTQRQKKADLYDLVQQKHGNGIVFCDSRDRGEELSEELSVPFVNGDTPASDRLDIIDSNRVTVVSRVGDEGLSVPDLDWTIEHDFHGSSRRQETQRAGRVMHGDGSDADSEGDGQSVVDETNGLHIVQMTDREIDEYGERLHSLREKGFEIQMERRA